MLTRAVDRGDPSTDAFSWAVVTAGASSLPVGASTLRVPEPASARPTLPAVEPAVTTHVGPHDDIDVTYGELGAWVVTNALAVAGPVRESYVVGPRDTPDPAAWRTEIGWPVFHM